MDGGWIGNQFFIHHTHERWMVGWIGNHFSSIIPMRDGWWVDRKSLFPFIIPMRDGWWVDRKSLFPIITPMRDGWWVDRKVVFHPSYTK
jgi:hypothetical protein